MFAMWSLSGFYSVAIMFYVVAMWLLYGSYVVAMWLVCSWYAVAMWLFCGCYAVDLRFGGFGGDSLSHQL